MDSAYKALYLTCFPEDTPEDADLLFEKVFSKAELVAELDGDRPIAMLFLMESQLLANTKAYPFYYLYAACTHPDYRGQGIMQRLLAKAKRLATEKGRLGIFLKPANPPLFDFYKKSDFSPFFKVCKILSSAQEFHASCRLAKLPTLPTLTTLSMADWHTKRKAFLNDCSDLYADFNPDLFIGATAGCTAICTDTGAAAVYEVREDTLLIKEALCRPNQEKELLAIADTLLKQTHCSNIELRLPDLGESALLGQFGAKTEFFSVIWDDGTLPRSTFQNPYHGFAFD